MVVLVGVVLVGTHIASVAAILVPPCSGCPPRGTRAESCFASCSWAVLDRRPCPPLVVPVTVTGAVVVVLSPRLISLLLLSIVRVSTQKIELVNENETKDETKERKNILQPMTFLGPIFLVVRYLPCLSHASLSSRSGRWNDCLPSVLVCLRETTQ